MGALAKAAAEAGGQSDTGFSKLVAQLVGRGQCIFPPLLAAAVEQVNLGSLRRERGGLHSQQADLGSLPPIFPE